MQTASISAIAAVKARLNTQNVDKSLENDQHDLDYDSEAGMDVDDEDDISEVESSHSENYSTWKQTTSNFRISQSGEKIFLNHSQTLSIIGQYDMTVQSGVVGIYGAVLNTKSPTHRITAPSHQPIPLIRCISGDGAEIYISHIPDQERYEILSPLSPLFRDIWASDIEGASTSTFQKVLNSRNLNLRRKVDVLEVPSNWNRTINRINQDFENSKKRKVLIVCGKRHTETSIFTRHFINRALSSDTKADLVTFMDLDSSSPILAYPHHVGLYILDEPLLQPSFALQTLRKSTQIYSYPVDLKTIQEQRVIYEKLLSSVPSEASLVVINFPSWNAGIANKVIVDFLPKTKATDIVSLSDPPNLISQAIKKLNTMAVYHDLTEHSLTSTHNNLPLEQHNNMVLQAYFHSLIQNQKLRLLSRPISHWRPYVVSFDDIAAVQIPPDIDYIFPNMLFKALNKSLVSVIELDEDHDALCIDHGQEDDIPYIWQSRINPSHANMIGLLLIRSIDICQRTFFVLGQSGVINQPASRLVLDWGSMKSPFWCDFEDEILTKLETTR